MIEKAKCFLPAALFALAILLTAPPSISVATLPTVIPEPVTPRAAPPVQGVVKAPEKPIPEAAAIRAPALPVSFQEGEGYAYKDGAYRGTGVGYNGAITVQVTISEGEIASIEVLSHIEDQEYWDMSAAWIVNSIINRQSTNVDAVSGATYTCNGIILAVRDALRQALDKSGSGLEEEAPLAELPPPQHEDPPDELPMEDEPEDRRFLDGTYTGIAEGYNGDITVEVLVVEGEIASVALLSHAEDAECLDKAKAVMDAILLGQSTNVDVVSGATYTSVGIVLAVRDALLKAAVIEDGAEEDPGLSPPILPPDPDAEYIPIYGLYNDGEYTGSAAGYEGFIFVKVIIADNNITGIEVTRQVEEPAYYKSCIGILDRIVKRQGTDGIDAVSGATYTSNGLLGAVGKALEKARIQDEGFGNPDE
jgi:uncharacterized protein with FMN-binding domain